MLRLGLEKGPGAAATSLFSASRSAVYNTVDLWLVRSEV